MFDAAASALEEALDAGEFTLGARGWKRAQAEVMHGFLTRRVHWLDERTPQAAVWEEREQAWAEGGMPRPLRRAFIQSVREQIVRPGAAPDEAAERMRPLVRVLEIAAVRPQLTQAGYLPPASVRALASELGWEDYRPLRSEADVPRLGILMDFAKEAGLVHRTRSTLRLTDAGRTAVADPALLWELVVRALAAGGDFASAVRELLLARLLRAASDREAIEAELPPVMAEAGWRTSEGAVPTVEMLSYTLWDAIHPMDLLGILEVDEWPDRGLRLTGFGVDTARAVLWHRARAARESIG